LHFVLVVNPVSGKGSGLVMAREVGRRLQENGHEVLLLKTDPDPNHFKKKIKVILEETRVVCFGGDGTLHYFLNHCQTFHSVAFYGVGTANVISLEFDIPRDLNGFVDMLEAGRCFEIRPGRTQNGVSFLMMYSFGIDGYVLANASQTLKNRLGKAAFFFPALKAFLKYDYPTINITPDGGDQTLTGSFVMASRIKRYGGAFMASPEADPGSGLFQVTIFHGSGFWKTIRFFLRLIRGRAANSSDVTSLHCSRLHLEKTSTGYCQLDGDLHTPEITDLEVSTDTISLIIP